MSNEKFTAKTIAELYDEQETLSKPLQLYIINYRAYLDEECALMTRQLGVGLQLFAKHYNDLY